MLYYSHALNILVQGILTRVFLRDPQTGFRGITAIHNRWNKMFLVDGPFLDREIVTSTRCSKLIFDSKDFKNQHFYWSLLCKMSNSFLTKSFKFLYCTTPTCVCNFTFLDISPWILYSINSNLLLLLCRYFIKPLWLIVIFGRIHVPLVYYLA